MRIVVELRRDAYPQVVLNNLFKLTPLQSNFSANMLALVNGEPVIGEPDEIDEIDWMSMEDFFEKFSDDNIGL